jgi:hypothetical protein
MAKTTIDASNPLFIQQAGNSYSHNVNHVKTKANHSKQATSKSYKPNKEDQGTYVSLSSIYNRSRWTIDRGATDHICHSLKDFQSIKKIRPISVKLLNGEYIDSTMAGTLIFS